MPSVEVTVIGALLFVCFALLASWVIAVTEVRKLSRRLRRLESELAKKEVLRREQLDVISRALHYGKEVDDDDPRWTTAYDYALFFHREMERIWRARRKREQCSTKPN